MAAEGPATGEERQEAWIPSPVQLPLIVVLLVIPPFLGFALGGVAFGTATGALAIVGLIVFAARSRHETPIRFAGEADGQPVLVLALAAVDDAATANSIATLAEVGSAGREPSEHEVLVLAPASGGALQRWLSDTDEARISAQQKLTISLATLAAAGCHAEGRVVDADPVQALEDVAVQYGAERVAVVFERGGGEQWIDRLESRVDRPLHRIEVSG